MLREWMYCPDHGQLCQVIDTKTFWGETTYRVWLPGSNSIVRAPASRLKPVENAAASSSDAIAYVTVAAAVNDALIHDVLLAPVESYVIPLPHQILALSRATADGRLRYLFADEVGSGKGRDRGRIIGPVKNTA